MKLLTALSSTKRPTSEMAMATTVPITSSNAAKRYKKVDPREHVLLRPGMYIGSTEPDRLKTWTLDVDKNLFIKRDVDYVPGLYKIFDEILVNAIDHVTMLKKNKGTQHQVKSIKISIDVATGVISVENDGDGIPIVLHPETGVYVPEMIFGQLMTSSNYDDGEERVVGGQNGIGAKACNIFSKRFVVETVDAGTMKKYVQTFRDNMSTKDAPKITSVAAGKKPYTKISFLPDYPRFHCTGLSDDMHQVGGCAPLRREQATLQSVVLCFVCILSLKVVFLSFYSYSFDAATTYVP